LGSVSDWSESITIRIEGPSSSGLGWLACGLVALAIVVILIIVVVVIIIFLFVIFKKKKE
ncbi:MAG: hypothetical protein QXT63_02725, partial [Thermoplasmata archaeon]